MSGFKQLHVKGFRRLLDVQFELRPLCVMIGANGGGKTSLLDVFSLLAASASGKLGDKISEFGGINAVLTQDRAKQLSIELSMTVPNQEPLRYELTLSPTGIGYEISREMMSQQRAPAPPPLNLIQSQRGDVRYFDPLQKKLVPPTWEHNSLETSLSQASRMFPDPDFFRRQLASSTYYHVLNVEPRAPVRQPQPLRPAQLPGRDGEDLVSCLYTMRESDRDRFEAIQDGLRAAFPGFERLDFPPVAAGTLAMTWKDRNFSRPLYMHQLSEGTLRFLWLTTLLNSPGLTAITLLDEPEVSLHPELLSLLAGMLREASARTQLVVATHADRLVRFLEPREVVALDLGEDGCARAAWADEFDLNEWLEDYTLDEVWRLGRIGGRS